MKKTILFLFLFGFQIAFTQKISVGSPESVGMSAERLGRIDRLFQDYVDNGFIAGASAIIIRDGKIVYHKAIGYDDVATRNPLQKDAIFRIASQTKALTSLAVLILFEEGKLLLNDPISKYIPEFAKPKVIDKYNEADTTFTTIPARSEITIRQLLTHTSGINYPDIGSPSMRAIYAKHDISSGIGSVNRNLKVDMERLSAMPLTHQPGERFTYGLNNDLLGYLVEVISGKSLDQFMRERIFQPLGMDDTYFLLPKEKHDKLAILYTEDKSKKLIKYPMQGMYDPNYPLADRSEYFSGGAGLSSTLYDYAIFLQMILNSGKYNGKRIISPATVNLMMSNNIGDLNVGDKKYSLAFHLATQKSAGMEVLSEGTMSWGGYFGTQYWADPKQRIVAVIMTQKVPNSYSDLSEKFKVLTYTAIEN